MPRQHTIITCSNTCLMADQEDTKRFASNSKNKTPTIHSDERISETLFQKLRQDQMKKKLFSGLQEPTPLEKHNIQRGERIQILAKNIWAKNTVFFSTSTACVHAGGCGVAANILRLWETQRCLLGVSWATFSGGSSGIFPR